MRAVPALPLHLAYRIPVFRAKMPVSFSHNHPECQPKGRHAKCCTSLLNLIEPGIRYFVEIYYIRYVKKWGILRARRKQKRDAFWRTPLFYRAIRGIYLHCWAEKERLGAMTAPNLFLLLMCLQSCAYFTTPLDRYSSPPVEMTLPATSVSTVTVTVVPVSTLPVPTAVSITPLAPGVIAV